MVIGLSALLSGLPLGSSPALGVIAPAVPMLLQVLVPLFLAVSILFTATPEDVRAYCKRLIDYAGKGGGLIMDASAGVNDAKVENVRAMFDFTKEYGVYAR